MNVQVKSSNGITLVPVETRLMAERNIFIEGEINPESACEFVKKVMYLNRENAEKPIHVLINSDGGEINSGMLMYDVIQSSKAPIQMYCIGHAYSMAAVLFASGNHGRYMLPQEYIFRRGQKLFVTKRYNIMRNELYLKITEEYENKVNEEER